MFRQLFSFILIFSVAAPNVSTQQSTVRIIDHPRDNEWEIVIGPIDLPVMDEMMGHGMAGMPSPPVVTVPLPFDASVYGIRYVILDGEGNELPTEILHHLNVVDPSYVELFHPIARRMAAAGSETGSPTLPWFLFGYPVKQDQEVAVSATLHNPTGVEHNDVTVRFFMKYVKGGRPWPLFDVFPFHIDVAYGIIDRSFDIPPGESTVSFETSPAIAGRIMGLGSHLHEYATKIRFEDVTEDRVIWEAEPILAEDGSLDLAPVARLYWKFGVKVYPDRVYRASVTYDNPTGETIPSGGMGVVAGVFIPKDADAWPTADTTDSVYVADLNHYLGLDKNQPTDSMPMGMDHSQGH